MTGIDLATLANDNPNNDGSVAAVEEDKLQRIISMAQRLAEQKREINELNAKLAAALQREKEIECNEFPELMKELGLNHFGLEDGSLVELVQEIQCGITEARRSSAHKWLIDNKFGGLIKTEVVATFGRGELELAKTFYESMLKKAEEDEVKADIGMKEAVHASTLKSFVKEQLSEAKEIPTDLFGIYQYNIVKVTLPKPKKTKKYSA